MSESRKYENRHMLPLKEGGHENTCLLIASEECAELIQAIQKAQRGKLNRENLIEEIADVIICIDWVKEIFAIQDEELNTWVNFKKNRVASNTIKGEFK